MATAIVLIAALHPAMAQTRAESNPETIRYAGIVEPARSAVFAPRVDALLEKIFFIPNQFVKKGDLLFQFLRTETEIQLELERARLKKAKAKLALAEVSLRNNERLRRRDAISKYQLLQAQANREIAAAELDESRASVRKAEFNLKELSLYAPFDGLMSEPFFKEGSFLKRERRSRLAQIIQLDPIRVFAEVPFDFYYDRRLIAKTDQEVKDNVELSLVLPNGVRYAHKGSLLSGGYRFERKSQTIRVMAEFPNPDHLLRPGLKVTLESKLRTKN